MRTWRLQLGRPRLSGWKGPETECSQGVLWWVTLQCCLCQPAIRELPLDHAGSSAQLQWNAFTVHHDLVVDLAIASCQLCTGPRRCHSCRQDCESYRPEQHQRRRRRPQGSGTAAGASSAGPWNGGRNNGKRGVLGGRWRFLCFSVMLMFNVEMLMLFTSKWHVGMAREEKKFWWLLHPISGD